MKPVLYIKEQIIMQSNH